MFSYTAQKDSVLLESDLTCLYKVNSWRDSKTYVVHAECKSFNRFERRDIARMRELSAAFPSAVLVFATLNESLNQQEIALIGPLVKSERRKRFRGLTNNPIIVLTGVELFSSSGVRDCWKGKDGLYEKFNNHYFDFSDLTLVADATNQIYLGEASWHDWSEAEMEKRKRPRKATR